MRANIAPLQPPTLASIKTWGIQQELVVSTRTAKEGKKISKTKLYVRQMLEIFVKN